MPGDRPRRACLGPARGDRPRRRRGRDGGLLARLSSRPGQARADRRAAGNLRCPRGAEGGDRPGAGLPLAALHFLRDCLGHARRDEHGALAALIRPIFNQASQEEARDRLSEAVAALDGKLPKVCEALERAEEDILAFYAFPDDASLLRLTAMLAIEQNDEWLVAKTKRR